MRTIKKSFKQDNDFIHPFWLEIFILFTVIMIIGILCCLRKKCGSSLQELFKRLFSHKNEANENNSNDDGSSINSYHYQWPSIYISSKSQSPKLYTLVKNIQTVNHQKRVLFKKQQINHENENDMELNTHIETDNLSQASKLAPTDSFQKSEIARKFYASMRNSSQCQNSSSLDSDNNDITLTPDTPSSTNNQPIKSNRDLHMTLFRTPYFFQSVPHQDSLALEI